MKQREEIAEWPAESAEERKLPEALMWLYLGGSLIKFCGVCLLELSVALLLVCRLSGAALALLTALPRALATVCASWGAVVTEKAGRLLAQSEGDHHET